MRFISISAQLVLILLLLAGCTFSKYSLSDDLTRIVAVDEADFSFSYPESWGDTSIEQDGVDVRCPTPSQRIVCSVMGNTLVVRFENNSSIEQIFLEAVSDEHWSQGGYPPAGARIIEACEKVLSQNQHRVDVDGISGYCEKTDKGMHIFTTMMQIPNASDASEHFVQLAFIALPGPKYTGLRLWQIYSSSSLQKESSQQRSKLLKTFWEQLQNGTASPEVLKTAEQFQAVVDSVVSH